MKRMLQLMLVMLLAVAPSAQGAAAAGGEVETTLAALQQQAAGVTTLQGDFIQEKHLAMFQEVLISKGRFAFVRPDRLRWELIEPVASGFVLKGDKGRRWNARSGTEEAFELSKEPVMRFVSEQLFAWVGADFSKLRARYRISVVQSAPVILKLVPLDAGGFLDHLEVAFAKDGRYPEMVEVHERGGDFTRIRFLNMSVNVPLPPSRF